MDKSYYISRPHLFSRRYTISDQQNIIALLKYKGLIGNKATADFNNNQWVIKPNFLNNKISISPMNSELTQAYEFNASLVSANSKGSIEFEGKEYNFKQLFGKWAGYVWLDNANNEIITYSLRGLLNRKGKITLSDKISGDENLMPIIVLGLYLSTYSFPASSR